MEGAANEITMEATKSLAVLPPNQLSIRRAKGRQARAIATGVLGLDQSCGCAGGHCSWRCIERPEGSLKDVVL